MKTLLSILPIIVLVASCTADDDKSFQASSRFDTLPLPADSTTFYFKTKVNQQDIASDALDTFVNTWYSYMLFALKEPVLKDYKGEKEVYRFTWLRSFNHPVVIRIEKQGTSLQLFSKASDGAGGYKPGKIIYDTILQLTQHQFGDLNLKLENTEFWTLETEKRDDNGLDGSEWIVEVYKNKKYHLVVRWSPGEGTAFRAIGEYLLSISQIREETDEQDDY